MTIQFAENVAHQYKLKWGEMSKLLDFAFKNVDFDSSEAYVSVIWK